MMSRVLGVHTVVSSPLTVARKKDAWNNKWHLIFSLQC